MHGPDEKVKKSLKYSVWDGVFSGAMIGFTQEYLAPFLLELGATVRQIGLLSALPNFVGSIVQMNSIRLTEKLKARRHTINLFVLLQALMLLPMSFMAYKGTGDPFIFIGMVILFTAFGAIATPPWSSLMSDLVPQEKRGAYFGWRYRAIGFVNLGATFMAGFILHRMTGIKVYLGFFIIFFFAFIFRMVSLYFLTRMYEPHFEHKKEDEFTLYQFLARIRESNFAKFVLFVSMMSFSVNLSAPFFAVLMLKDLKFNYLLYTLIIITAQVMTHLSIRRWGKHADHVGNLKVLKLTARLIAPIPLFWIFCQKPAFLFCVQMFAGFAWSGFSLCATNFIYDAVSPGKRIRCVSYFNFLNGIAIAAGAFLGGYLLNYLPGLFGNSIYTLLLMSGVLRLIFCAVMPGRLKEVRVVKRVSSNRLFLSMIGIKPVLGIDRETLKY
jgi:MFS family permease